MRIIYLLFVTIFLIVFASCGRRLSSCSCFGVSSLQMISVFNAQKDVIAVDRVELYRYYDQKFLEELMPVTTTTNNGTLIRQYMTSTLGNIFEKENAPLTLELRAIKNNEIVGSSVFRMMRTCCAFQVIEGNVNINTEL